MEGHSRGHNLTTNLIAPTKSNNNSIKSHSPIHGKEEKHGREWMGAIIADTGLETSKLYLALPSYPEPQKKTIKNIIAAEKAKLCSNSLFKNIFANIDFEIAFANSKNIKQMRVRTKI